MNLGYINTYEDIGTNRERFPLRNDFDASYYLYVYLRVITNLCHQNFKFSSMGHSK